LSNVIRDTEAGFFFSSACRAQFGVAQKGHIEAVRFLQEAKIAYSLAIHRLARLLAPEKEELLGSAKKEVLLGSGKKSAPLGSGRAPPPLAAL
jgi:hypothetical protein